MRGKGKRDDQEGGRMKKGGRREGTVKTRKL